MMLWMIMMAMAGAATFWLVRPLFTEPAQGGDESLSREQVNASIFRERLAELEQERDQGRLTGDEFETLKAELQLTLLQDVPSSAPAAPHGERLPPAAGQARFALNWPLIAIILVLPTAMIGFYLGATYQPAVKPWLQSTQQLAPVIDQVLIGQRPKPEDMQDHDVADFVFALQNRLQRSSANTDAHASGWLMLGAIYRQLERLEEVNQAYRKAYDLAPQRVDVAIRYASALVQRNQGRLDRASRRVLNGVLIQDPKQPEALSLKAMAAYNSGDYREAITAWETLLAIPTGSVLSAEAKKGQAMIKRRIASAQRKLAAVAMAHNNTDKLPDTSADKTPEPVTSTGRMGASANPAQQTPASGVGPLTVTVGLSEALKSKVSPGAQLFVFAKAKQGPPMPLAVVKQPVGTWPVTVTLDDSTAMMPAMKLSSVSAATITARITASGNAKAQAGDLEADLAQVTAGGQSQLALTIDKIVPYE